MTSHLQQAVRIVGAVVLLALGGLVLKPFTSILRQQEESARLHYPIPRGDRQDMLSQQLAIFCLGGLRTLAAEILSLDATNAWMKRDWKRAEQRWRAVTTLAPHRLNYWVTASRDMATNAAADVANDHSLAEHERALQRQHYITTGEEILLRGIANNPDSALLYINLGDLYSNLYRRPQFAKAAAAYHRAVELGAGQLYARQEFYNLCRIRGREQEAWQLGRKLFEDSHNNVPSVRILLFVLQNKLNIPREEQMGIEQIFGTKERAVRDLKLFKQNSLRYPTTGIKEFLEQNS